MFGARSRHVPSDSALRLTTWWTVPLSGSEFVSWVGAQAPAGLHVDPAGGKSGNISSFAVSGIDTAAFTTPTLAVNYIDRGDRTEVRLDTFISARYGRSTFIPATTRVTIRRTQDSLGTAPGAVTTRKLSDPRRAQVVMMANRLPGVSTGDCVHSCPPLGPAAPTRCGSSLRPARSSCERRTTSVVPVPP